MAFAAGRRQGCPGGVVAEGFLDALRGWVLSDALVDRDGLLQLGGACACVAVLEVAAAEALEGACFL